MSSKAITDKRDDQPPGGGWRPLRESVPSLVHQDEPRLARIVGLWGLMLAVVSVFTILLTGVGGYTGLLGYGWSIFLLAIGVLLLLYHAAQDHDIQVRRMYALLGAGLLALGLILPWPTFKEVPGGLFGIALPCLLVAPFFLLAMLRHEDEAQWREYALNGLGLAGAALALAGFGGGSLDEKFLVGGDLDGKVMLPRGVILCLLGLVYLSAYVGMRGTDEALGYRVGLIVGTVGLVFFLIALVRSVVPGLLYSWGQSQDLPSRYFVTSGVPLMILGLLYLACSVMQTSEARFVVLTRRELGGFFHSPVAYLVLAAMILVSAARFLGFLGHIERVPGQPGPAVVEPVVAYYFVDIVTVFFLVAIVPAITMRLLSEEKRSGTLEVLLTAPVSETMIVLSKFLAALVFFLLTWLPFVIYLFALRIEGRKPFDYEPLLSFYIALTCLGMGFIGVGLFFSSLTWNQIVSFVFTLAWMLLATVLYFLKDSFGRQAGGVESTTENAWTVVLRHMSYLDVWIQSLQGTLMPRYLLFHLSVAVLSLFLTIKVLEARKWS